MKKLEKFFRKLGKADVNLWGYSTLHVMPKENA
jgi:hypothetical protein